MQCDLTKTELERLIELAYLGERMLNDHRPEGERSVTHDSALQKLYTLAEEEGLGYLVATNEATGDLVASPALEARIDTAGFIEEYDDCVFWDDLAIRLAERDLRTEIGVRAFDALPAAERRDRVDAITERYDQEFDQRGIERLHLDRPVRRRRTRDALTERIKKLFDDGK